MTFMAKTQKESENTLKAICSHNKIRHSIIFKKPLIGFYSAIIIYVLTHAHRYYNFEVHIYIHNRLIVVSNY